MTGLAFELRAERARRGLSQERMASALCVSLRQYQRWEGGGSAPRGHEREWLLASLGGPAAGDPGVAAELTALQREIQELRGDLAQVRARLQLLRARQAA